MIRITCVPSKMAMLPVRALLDRIQFRPKDHKQLAGYALIYPFSGRFRRSLRHAGYVERVPEAQFLGITSQRRIYRWLNWLARAVAPFLHKQRIFFYCAEHLDKPTRIFLKLLRRHVAPGTINAMFGETSYDESYRADTVNCLLAEERPILAAMSKHAHELTPNEVEMLNHAGVGAVLSANFWMAERVYHTLAGINRSRSLFVAGLAHRFYGHFPAAEWYYERALATNNHEVDPVEHIQIRYSLMMLHLRFHDRRDANEAAVAEHLERGYALIEGDFMAPETRIYSRTMLDAARALAEFRCGALSAAMATVDRTINRVESLPESPRRNCCLVYSFGNKAQIFRATGDLKQAAEFNERAATMDPQEASWWVEWIKCFFDLGQYDRAQEVLEQAMEHHFDEPELFELQGRYFRHTGQHERSEQSYQRAVRYALFQSVATEKSQAFADL